MLEINLKWRSWSDKKLPHFRPMPSGPSILSPTTPKRDPKATTAGKAIMLGKPRGEGLTEEVSLMGRAEAEGGNGLLMGPDDTAAKACTHVEQPDHSPKACSCQHVPALLVACLGGHHQGGPGHGEELLRRVGGRKYS